MVKGLQLFAEHFKGFEACYILIGGAACDLWLGEQGLEFRKTKDLDVVLIVDELNKEFFERFWALIGQAKYKSLQTVKDRPTFYRFEKPQTERYPDKIELLTRNALNLPNEFHLTPVPAGEDLSSLSAILLHEEYYKFLLASRITVAGMPTVPGSCLIPLKARAHLDLSGRKARGDKTIREEDVQKHRYDVFRLYLALKPEDRFDLPNLLRADLVQFLDKYPSSASKDWESIRQALGKQELPPTKQVIQQLWDIFKLGDMAGIVKPL